MDDRVERVKHEVERIIKDAGEIVLNYFARSKELVHHTKDKAGFFTEADVQTEQFLIKKLNQLFPEAAICAEESGNTGQSEYCWVIDPIDGTTNFAHGLPHFCISIALTQNHNPIFGMIYSPVLDELFWAETGKGAWLNDTKISVTSTETFEDSLLVVGFPYKGIDGEYARFMEHVSTIGPQAYTFRNLGAAALDLAYTACGRFDAIFCSRMQWWDFAAGALLIKEAGGVITDFEGASLSKDSASFAAGGALVHKRLLELLSK